MIHSAIDFLKSLYTDDGIRHIIASGGLIVLVAIVFSETGLLLGFFLPGDSLLVTAGVVAAAQPVELPIVKVALFLTVAAILGVQTGYWLGRKTGHAIFHREDGRIFKKRYVTEAHEFYVQHGGKALVMAQFLPMFRTFVPFMAGVAEMPYRRFLAFNIVGGILWVNSLVWLGYGLGQTPWAKRLDRIIIIVVVVSFLPIIFGAAKKFWQARKSPAAQV